MRFLLADDNSAILEQVGQLIDKDHSVRLISNPREIVGEVDSTHPDIVVLDIAMGDVSGFEVAAELQRREFKGKIIFLSIHSDADFVRAALSSGDAYILKSCVASDLLPAVAAVCVGQPFVSAALSRSSL